ncbi:malonate transporter [Aliiroseovarius zhejiangensis]|uniref:Malonate transporter n=1 Tax=Aliiroseovarius zhejiangensis TaxID=1632025 RepID=A0ABQ3IMH4_9RHOB|nr:AEC family transporter [Aliiroseovarius zhejiangensis]GHE88122.1 malonate transporter [Aliiroseovarius zhejiangensis]
MSTLVDIVLPVFLVIGFGYLVRWRRLLDDGAVDGLMRFAQSVAIPCLLFLAIARLDLGAEFDLALLGSFYTGAVSGFAAGLLGARLLFGRPWPDAVAFGFVTLFSNSLLLGLPITERAFGPDALAGNYAIISIHAPICYAIGITAMEIARAQGAGPWDTLRQITRAMTRNMLVLAIAAGFVVNLMHVPLPGVLVEALTLLGRAALPTALFALGGVLYLYRPEGDLRIVTYLCLISLFVHPAITWGLGLALGLNVDQFRSAIVTAASAPGINAYIFANLYGVGKRVAATTVLVATGLSILTVWGWLAMLAAFGY